VPPARHRFWQRTEYGRRVRRRQLLAASVSAVLLSGGCLAAVSVVPECAFDPPPGDYYGLHVRNDSPSPVTLADCADSRCLRAINPQDVRPGQSANIQVEACSGGTLGVTRPGDHTLLGCLDEPIGDPQPTVTHLPVSTAHPCAGGPPPPRRVSFYNPS
jgi:hypothetical protein